MGADRGPGAGGGVADVVAAAVKRGQAVLGELAHHRRNVVETEVVQLARGQADAALGVGLDDLRQAAQLRGGQHAARHDDPGHEVIGVAGGVDAVGLGDLGFFERHLAVPRDFVEIEEQAALLDDLIVAAPEIRDAPLHAGPCYRKPVLR